MLPISSFRESYGKSSTKKAFSAAVFSFLDYLHGPQRAGRNATKEETARYEALAAEYLKDRERDRHKDLVIFAASQTAAGTPPHTANLRVTGIVGFLAFHGIEFSQREIRRIRAKLPRGGARTVEMELTVDRLRAILQHLNTPGRALILALASSGMRIGEAVQIQTGDLDLSSRPAEITIRGEYTKNGEQRFTFISAEAQQALEEWLKVRDRYQRGAQNRNAGLVEGGLSKDRPSMIADNRIFPFSDQNAREMWNRAAEKAGLGSIDPGTGRRQLHLHMLRKFYLSQLSLAVSKEIPETLAGHAGYLTDAYRRYTKDQLRKEYLRGEPHLTILAPRDYQEVQTEFRAKLGEQGEILTGLYRENLALREEITQIQQEVAATKALVESAEVRLQNELLNRPEEVRQEIWREMEQIIKKKISI